MPFPYTHRKQPNMIRKESDSFVVFPYNPPIHSCERVSRFASRGSITVEASIAVSVFFFAMLTLSSILELIYLQANIRSALCHVGKQMAAESYLQPLVLTEQMERRMWELIDEEWKDQVEIDCSRSRRYLTTTIMELVVDYEAELPWFMFRIPILSRSEKLRIKGWTGRDGLGLGTGMDEIVYMTANGIVYHEDLNCSYLDLSIRPIAGSDIEEYRNAGGEKYYSCERCNGFGQTDTVYITEHGNRYHRSFMCSGLKRIIYTVSKKDIFGIGGCSKCTK